MLYITSYCDTLNSETLLDLFWHSKEYRKEILFPVMQFISRQRGQPELYEGLISDLDPLAMPRGASEMEVKMRQVRIDSFRLIAVRSLWWSFMLLYLR